MNYLSPYITRAQANDLFITNDSDTPIYNNAIIDSDNQLVTKSFVQNLVNNTMPVSSTASSQSLATDSCSVEIQAQSDMQVAHSYEIPRGILQVAGDRIRIELITKDKPQCMMNLESSGFMLTPMSTDRLEIELLYGYTNILHVIFADNYQGQINLDRSTISVSFSISSQFSSSLIFSSWIFVSHQSACISNEGLSVVSPLSKDGLVLSLPLLDNLPPSMSLVTDARGRITTAPSGSALQVNEPLYMNLGRLSLRTSTLEADESTTQIYVSIQDGDDSNSGTILHPFQTITKALSIADGKVIHILSGVYPESLAISQSSITYIGYNATLTGDVNITSGTHSFYRLNFTGTQNVQSIQHTSTLPIEFDSCNFIKSEITIGSNSIAKSINIFRDCNIFELVIQDCNVTPFSISAVTGEYRVSGTGLDDTINNIIIGGFLPRGTYVVSGSNGYYLTTDMMENTGTFDMYIAVITELHNCSITNLEVGKGHYARSYTSFVQSFQNDPNGYNRVDTNYIAQIATQQDLSNMNVQLGDLVYVKGSGPSGGLYQSLGRQDWRQVIPTPTYDSNVYLDTNNKVGIRVTDTGIPSIRALCYNDTQGVTFMPCNLTSNIAITWSDTPPAASNIGDIHIIGSNATGAWSGQNNQIAVSIDGLDEWRFISPSVNSLWFVSSLIRAVTWDGTSFNNINIQSTPPLSNSDVTNKLYVDNAVSSLQSVGNTISGLKQNQASQQQEVPVQLLSLGDTIEYHYVMTTIGSVDMYINNTNVFTVQASSNAIITGWLTLTDTLQVLHRYIINYDTTCVTGINSNLSILQTISIHYNCATNDQSVWYSQWKINKNLIHNP